MMRLENFSPIATPQSNVCAMFDDLSDEWREWFSLTPLERLKAGDQLWSMFLTLGGNLDPEPDPQSPFYFPEASRPCAAYGGQACV